MDKAPARFLMYVALGFVLTTLLFMPRFSSSVDTGGSSVSTGAAASGAATAGNPVKIGGVFNTTPPTVTTGQIVEAQYSARGAAHVMGAPQANDPCQSDGVAKSSVVLNVTASAEVIAASGTTRIYVCGFNATVGGTAPTYKFHYGTGAVCVTGSTDLTGTYLPLVGSQNTYAPGMTAFATTASQALCITTGGTTPSVQGVLTFVQQ